MRVAIIGANGQLGSALVETFKDEAMPFTHQNLDVTKYDTLKILKKVNPDVIINTAAYVRVDDAELNPEYAFKVNAVGALNVAKVSNEIGAINVYISTDYVFDGRKNAPYTEEDMPNPINVYGASKYAGEIFTKNYSEKYYIIRVASLFGGRGARGKGGNFVTFIMDKIRKKEKIYVVDDMYISPTYTKDVAIALYKFLNVNPDYGIYHMVNEGICTWYDFAEEIVKIYEVSNKLNRIKSSELKRLAKRPRFSGLENRKLHELGIKLPEWREALKSYLSSLRGEF